MNRPRGITVLAYISLVWSGIGFLLTLAIGLLALPDSEYPWWLIFVGALVGLPIAVGLLKLKNWARILTIVGALLTCIRSGEDLLGSLSGSDASLFDAVFMLGVVAFNIWILWYLNLPHVKEAFGVS
jgi:hypothetical protein